MFRPFCLLTAFLWLSLPTPSYAGPAGYWTNFKKYWTGFLGAQNGVVMTVLLVGAVSLLILMSGGRWRK